MLDFYFYTKLKNNDQVVLVVKKKYSDIISPLNSAVDTKNCPGTTLLTSFFFVVLFIFFTIEIKKKCLSFFPFLFSTLQLTE